MKDNFSLNRSPKVIWVFRTTLVTHMDVRRVARSLDDLMQNGDKWNFDLEDCDHILRVETRSVQVDTIIQQLRQAGYECAELEDNYGVVPQAELAW
jgi:hypothetical protein